MVVTVSINDRFNCTFGIPLTHVFTGRDVIEDW